MDFCEMFRKLLVLYVVRRALAYYKVLSQCPPQHILHTPPHHRHTSFVINFASRLYCSKISLNDYTDFEGKNTINISSYEF